MPRWRPDVPFAETGDAPERPRPTLTERERRLAAWEQYIGPHAAKGVSNLMDLVGEMSPGADIRDALEASREMMTGARERDARRFLESVPALGVALAGVMVPGRPGALVPTAKSEEAVRRVREAFPHSSEPGAYPSSYRVALAELDALGAPDEAYRRAFSSMTRKPLRKGETWRGRLIETIRLFERYDIPKEKALVPWKIESER